MYKVENDKRLIQKEFPDCKILSGFEYDNVRYYLVVPNNFENGDHTGSYAVIDENNNLDFKPFGIVLFLSGRDPNFLESRIEIL